MHDFGLTFLRALSCFALGLALMSCSLLGPGESAEHKAWSAELLADYCAPALSDLARGIPDGVEAIVERVNPYPALPDYRLYPDTSVAHQNATILFKLARCVHKKCVAGGPDKSKTVPVIVPDGCGDAKANFFVESFLGLVNSCGSTRYIKTHALRTVKAIYEKREAKPLNVCPALLEGEPLVAEAMGQAVAECSVQDDKCPEGLRCVLNGEGTRCVENAGTDLGAVVTSVESMKPTPAVQNPGDEPATGLVFDPKALAERCLTSRECVTGSSCIALLGGEPRCAKHCATASDCTEAQTCHALQGNGQVCVETCASEALAATPDGKLCVPTATGGVVAAIEAENFLAAYAGLMAKNGTIEKAATPWTPESFGAMAVELGDKSKCGNGVVEFPEVCDAGEANGKPRYGGWCTTTCELNECGNGRLEAPETCECLPSWAAKAAADNAKGKYRSICPSSYAQSNGSEVAMGWLCSSSCEVLMPPETAMSPRKNRNYLPEFLCLRPKLADGTIRPECIPTNLSEEDKKAFDQKTGEPNPVAPFVEPESR